MSFGIGTLRQLRRKKNEVFFDRLDGKTKKSVFNILDRAFRKEDAKDIVKFNNIQRTRFEWLTWARGKTQDYLTTGRVRTVLVD